MKIYYQVPIMGPEAGGVWVVCRHFLYRMPELLPEHEYYVGLMEGQSKWYPIKTHADAACFLNSTLPDALARKGIAGTRIQDSVLKKWYTNSQMAKPLRQFKRKYFSSTYSGDQASRYTGYTIPSDACVMHAPLQWYWPPPPYHFQHIPVVMNMHDLQHEHFPDNFDEHTRQTRKRVWYDCARNARFVVAAATHIRDDIVRFIGLDEERVKVIPWGAPFEGEHMPSDSDINRCKATLPFAGQFLLYPAVTWPHKNHVALVTAFSIISKKYPDVHLVFTGAEGSAHHDLLEYIEKQGLTSRIHHLGRVDDMILKSLYRLAAMTIVPSLHEQTSGPMMEAMVSGCPVSVSNIADHAELLGKNAGGLFNPNKIEEISEAMDHMLANPHHARQMAENAKQRIHLNRSWKLWASAYAELYQQCALESNGT
jgi:glycosyltransferase involved in cell wall biosynthesis